MSALNLKHLKQYRDLAWLLLKHGRGDLVKRALMPLLVVSIMSQLVFSGGMIWVTDRIVLDQLSWGTPARWGYAASASTIDTHRLIPGPTDPKDQHWDHKASAWLFDMAMLGVLCIVYGAITWWKIRLKRR